MGKGAMDENSPLYIGTTALSEENMYIRHYILQNTIILVGHDVINR